VGKNSKIEWCDHTFSPWWGCTKVSPGCTNCYAETLSVRYGHEIWGPKASRRFFGYGHWSEPEKWDAEAKRLDARFRVFCGSMCDVFETRKDLVEYQKRLWSLIEATTNLNWLLLTKRPENVQKLAPWGKDWPDNVWLGVSVEDQKRADERIPVLLSIPAKVRFLSCEPLLGRLTLQYWMAERLSWLIIGGESGVGHRTMELWWLLDIVDWCIASNIPAFVKQDSGRHAGRQGRIPDELWSIKEFPSANP